VNSSGIISNNASFTKKGNPFGEGIYEDMSIGQSEQQDVIGDALYKSLKSGGFNFIIDFSELAFDNKTDYIGGGGYGDVFQGKWLGLKVAIKRFGRKYVSRKAIKDFIKEIEVVHSLRHPNIILYMGVSFDSSQQYYMVTE